jgi:hypothetical protein
MAIQASDTPDCFRKDRASLATGWHWACEPSGSGTRLGLDGLQRSLVTPWAFGGGFLEVRIWALARTDWLEEREGSDRTL